MFQQEQRFLYTFFSLIKVIPAAYFDAIPRGRLVEVRRATDTLAWAASERQKLDQHVLKQVCEFRALRLIIETPMPAVVAAVAPQIRQHLEDRPDIKSFGRYQLARSGLIVEPQGIARKGMECDNGERRDP